MTSRPIAKLCLLLYLLGLAWPNIAQAITSEELYKLCLEFPSDPRCKA
jgi:hypothetical protein